MFSTCALMTQEIMRSKNAQLTNRRQFSMVYTLLLKTGSLYNAILGI